MSRSRLHQKDASAEAYAFDRMRIDLLDNQYGLQAIPKIPPKINYVPSTLSIDIVY